MNLARFPRRRYAHGPTPIEKLAKLSAELGGPSVYIKRDDLLGLAGGGSKTRKLEFIVADALSNGADTLITCGAIQSNHCRLTLAAAVKEGLKCRLVLQEKAPNSYNPRASGNNLLYGLLGAEDITVVPASSDVNLEMKKISDRLAEQGREAYIIPSGASNPIGATGYVACAEEILAQAFEMGLNIDRVVCASGSGGTHAGLIVGFFGNSGHIPTIGMNVSRRKDDQERQVYDLAQRTAVHVGLKGVIPREAVLCFDDYVGPGYALPTDQMVEAVKTLAKTEAILLDPVYTGKAMAGLIDLVKQGYFAKNENVLFVHTGGLPALYVYSDIFLK